MHNVLFTAIIIMLGFWMRKLKLINRDFWIRRVQINQIMTEKLRKSVFRRTSFDSLEWTEIAKSKFGEFTIKK